MPKRICSIEDCDRPARGSGMCRCHATRVERHGDPHITLTPTRGMSVAERIAISIEVDPHSGCWVWQRTLHSAGYGVSQVGRKPQYAHRLAYQEWVGPIPDGLELDHLCCNRRCCNPDHLEAVTHADNLRRAVVVREARRVPAIRFRRADGFLTLLP